MLSPNGIILQEARVRTGIGKPSSLLTPLPWNGINFTPCINNNYFNLHLLLPYDFPAWLSHQ